MVIPIADAKVLQQRYWSYNLKRSARVAYPGESAEELAIRRQEYLDGAKKHLEHVSGRAAYPGESVEELAIRRQIYLDGQTQRNELVSGRAAYPGESVEEQATRRQDFQEAARIQNNISRGNAPRKGKTLEEAKARGVRFKADQKEYKRNYNATVDKTERLRKDRQYTGLLPYDGESEESRKSRH